MSVAGGLLAEVTWLRRGHSWAQGAHVGCSGWGMGSQVGSFPAGDLGRKESFSMYFGFSITATVLRIN